MTGAIIYCRVSTLNQSEEGTSLHTQAEAAINYAKGLNLPVLNVLHEVYTGAELYDRPKLSQAREDIKTGKCSHLIAYSIDRLSRHPIHVAILAMEAERAGVQLLFVTEPLDNTPEGQLIMYVKGYAAQIEREKIRERCIRGKRQVALSGRIHRAGTELYGYIREDGKRIIHPLESLVVADIFKRIAEQGDSIRGVARYLNRVGCPTPSTGKRVYRDGRTPRWGKSTVTRILREPAYKGEAIAWRWQSKKIGVRQLIRMRPASEHIPLPEGTVPAIVSESTWAKAQPCNGGANTRNENREYLLRGRMTCHRCGEPMYPESSRNKRWYRCSSRDKAVGRCGALPTPADIVEKYVWRKLSLSMRKPSVLTAGLKTVQNESEIARLRKERRVIEAALEASLTGLQKMIRRFRAVESTVLLQAIDNEVKVAEQEQAKLRTKLEELDGRIQTARGVIIDMGKLERYCFEMAQLTFDFPQKVIALRAFAGHVRAEGKWIEFDVDISRFVVGETATTFSGYSPNSRRIIYTFTKKAA
jgi:site-specific DNA recombinase